MQKFYKKQQKEVEMERIDKTIEILKELLYEDRESLSPQGLDEQLDKAITNLRVLKEKDMKELRFSYFDEIDHIFNEQKKMIKKIKTISFKNHEQKEILSLINNIVYEFGSKYNDRIVKGVENGTNKK